MYSAAAAALSGGCRRSPNSADDRIGERKKEDEKEGHIEKRGMITERGRIHSIETVDTKDFVNYGLQRFEEGRAKWRCLEDPERRKLREMRRQVQSHIPDDEAIYDAVFLKPMGWRLPQPVPLAHMVEILEDEWSD